MVFGNLLSAIDEERTVDVLTVIDSTRAECIGKMLVIRQDGKVEADSEKSFIQAALDNLQTIPWPRPLTVCFEDLEGEKYRVFWDRITNKWNVIVFGGGHISQPLVQILSLLDFVVTVVDDRPEFANQARFPGAKNVICESFQRAFTQLVINSDTAVIIVTRGHRYDLECLRATMCSKAGYLGMIGSRKRVREVLNVLKEEGVTGSEKRIRAPIGLDIKAETPAEIAVSIAAEVVAVFRGGGSGHPLSMAGRDHNGQGDADKNL